MTYEKDIPEYALQPAKAPKTVPAEAIYHTLSGGGANGYL